MNTSYIRFFQQYNDPVWGAHAVGWVYTGIVRVTRNNLNKATFEWVGCPSMPFDLEQVRRNYPIVMYADLQNSGSELHSFRKRSPLPRWTPETRPSPEQE